MRPDVAAIQALCPQVEPAVVAAHLERLDADYLERSDAPTVASHLSALARLSAQNPVEILLADAGDARVECTVLAFDHPFEFSLITGVLTSAGVSIHSGDVFTLPRVGRGPRRSPRRAALATPPPRDPHHAAVIIDCFTGRREPGPAFADWSNHLRAGLTEVLGLLDRGDEGSVTTAKRRVNELVTQRLALARGPAGPPLAPVHLRLEPDARRTRLLITAPDTPAFLYSLSTALSLQNLSIQRVRIGGDAGRVEDAIDVVDADGQALTDPAVLERLRLGVLLTKQFTSFLDRAPDPFAALTRFESVVDELMRQPQRGQWFDWLSQPRAMDDLAKLLGTSDYLWEDFIRGQYESLLPIVRPHVQGRPFAAPPETLPLRLEQALGGAAGLEEKCDRLNRFKDQELFRIDLDHILSPGFDFRRLSEHLTLLAENLVATAARLVYDDLVAEYGAPHTADGRPAHYAVFGAGKLGGVALGYASDIELLFLHSGTGATSGARHAPISNTEFFVQHASGTGHFIRTKREGIFQVDLRLRPHGDAGPLASGLEHFREYYGPGGAAHPFERLALVRLRWIAGDPELGFAVEQLRDEFVYAGPAPDLDALWAIWGQMRQQHCRPGALNAKHSPGALTDLEGTVQLLQVTSAARAPQLRTPRLHEAMQALCRAGVLAPREFADLYGAYGFLRRLINALRVLRGSAVDLLLPADGSDELRHLARRMGYAGEDAGGPGRRLLEEFHACTSAVRAFVRHRFGRPCPGEK